MDSYLYESLKDLFRLGVVHLRKPKFRELPFAVNLQKMESIPASRDHVLKLLSSRIDARAYDAVTSAVDDCRALATSYADRCHLPFIIPIEVASSNKAPIILYGDAKQDASLVMVNAYNVPFDSDNMDHHPIVRALNVLQSHYFGVAKIVSIFDADRDHSLRRYLAISERRPIAYEVVYEMREVLRILESSPDDFGLVRSDVTEVIKHYELKTTIAPPS